MIEENIWLNAQEACLRTKNKGSVLKNNEKNEQATKHFQEEKI